MTERGYGDWDPPPVESRVRGPWDNMVVVLVSAACTVIVGIVAAALIIGIWAATRG